LKELHLRRLRHDGAGEQDERAVDDGGAVEAGHGGRLRRAGAAGRERAAGVAREA
jgi:hypothetical protein